MLARPDCVAEVIGSQLQPEDFFHPDTRAIYEATVEQHFAGLKVDAITVGERLRFPLSQMWRVEEGEASARLYSTVQGLHFTDSAADHAEVLRGLAAKRELQTVALSALHQINEGTHSAEQIGDLLTTEAVKITTVTERRSQIISKYDAGRDYYHYLQRIAAAREQGIEIGVRTGYRFFDDYAKGPLPGELMMVGGEPGVGKSAVVWLLSEAFARRQVGRDEKVSSLILSLEMGSVPSMQRLAQTATRIDGGKMREGDLTKQERRKIAEAFIADKELPLHFNFASSFRMSQMRALVAESIRRHNVGMVVIDHFRMFDPDRRINNPNQEDEAKVRFLKEQLAKDLDIAVICLAHTVKLKREGSDGRPTLADLRGSYQVAAHCDIVSFVYRPIMYASQEAIDEGYAPDPTDAELIFEKNRNGQLGRQDFWMDLAHMRIADR